MAPALLTVPAAQGAQLAWPVLSWDVPAGHTVHVADPESEDLPAGQSVQDADPSAL